MKRDLFVALVLVAACTMGCGNVEPVPANTAKQANTAAERANADAISAHDHSAWWCNEHGVPEEVCGLCNSKLAAEFQKKGDWCKEHDRPDSQCFHCHPELEAKFAAQYEAKFGKKAPKPES